MLLLLSFSFDLDTQMFVFNEEVIIMSNIAADILMMKTFLFPCTSSQVSCISRAVAWSRELEISKAIIIH